MEKIGRPEDKINDIKGNCKRILDKNERIAYLRAKCINTLTLESAELFLNNADNIINGTYNNGLMDELT